MGAVACARAGGACSRGSAADRSAPGGAGACGHWGGRAGRAAPTDQVEGAGSPAVDGRVHGGFSWVTVGGRQRQPDGPCSVEAETARLVRRRTGISANGCVLVLERSADGVGPDGGQVEDQAGHPRSRSGRPAAGVPAAGPRARSRRECVRRRQSRSAMPWARTRVAGGSRRFTGPGRGLGRRGSAGLDSCRAPGFRDQQGGVGNRGTRGRRCREGTGRHGAGGSRRRQLSWCCVGGGCFCGGRRCRCAIDGGRRPRRRSRRDVAAWNDAAWNDAVWWPGRRVAGERSCWLRNRGRGVAGERSCWTGAGAAGSPTGGTTPGTGTAGSTTGGTTPGTGIAGSTTGPVAGGVTAGAGSEGSGSAGEGSAGSGAACPGAAGGGASGTAGSGAVSAGPFGSAGTTSAEADSRPRNSARRPGARRDRRDVHGNHAVEGGNREVVGVRTRGGGRALAGVVGRPVERAGVVRLRGRAGQCQPRGAGDGGQKHAAQGAQGAQGAARAGGRCCRIHARTPAPGRLDNCLQGKSAPTGESRAGPKL